jgi:hypothetical protein
VQPAFVNVQALNLPSPQQGLAGGTEPFWFPSRRGGNLQEGGKNGILGSPHAVGGTYRRGVSTGHGNRAPTRAVRAQFPRPYPDALAPTPEVEQHLQQVRVIHNPVAVHIYTPEVAARVAKREQHGQQVGVIHAAVGVHIAVVRGAARSRIQQEGFVAPCGGVVALPTI